MLPQLTSIQRKTILVTQKKIIKTIAQNKLITNGDRVVVGLSGGKDSYILLHTLSQIRKRVPYDFELAAVHINTSNINFFREYDYMQQLCDFLEVPLQIIDIEIDLQTDAKLSKCFKCSWNRRTELFKYASQNNFNKIAFGHHLEDAVETLLMNMFYKGEISAMSYEVDMFNNHFKIIRPMLDIEQKFIVQYSEALNFVHEKFECEFAQTSKRDLIRNLINKLSETNPNVQKNLFRSMKKIIEPYLPKSQ